MDLLREYLWNTTASWFGIIGVIATVIWILEAICVKVPKVKPQTALVVVFVCFSIAQFQAYREIRSQIDVLNGLLHPTANVYMRWPESWFWNGQRYTADAVIKLNESAKLEMQTNASQRMDPILYAPPSQLLTNIKLFLTFSRPVTPIICDPTRAPLAIWSPAGNNSYYSDIDRINPGVGGNVPEAFCFMVAVAGPVSVRYAFSPEQTAPISGRFTIAVR